MIHENSLTHKVRDFVQSYPGRSTQDIATALLPATAASRRKVKRSVEYLRDQKVIENRGGGTGYPTKWFPCPPPKIKKKYRKLAGEILKELHAVHHTQREAVLAKRLQELMG